VVELNNPPDICEVSQAAHFVTSLLLRIKQTPHSQVPGLGLNLSKDRLPLEQTFFNSASPTELDFFPKISITLPGTSSVAGLMSKHTSFSLFLHDTSFLPPFSEDLLLFPDKNCTEPKLAEQFTMEVSTQFIFLHTVTSLFSTALRGLLKVKLSAGKHVLVFSVTVIGEANLKVLVTAGVVAAAGTTKSNFGRDVSVSEMLGRFTASTVSSSSSFPLALIFPPCFPTLS
jgi:hypothetical protein